MTARALFMSLAQSVRRPRGHHFPGPETLSRGSRCRSQPVFRHTIARVRTETLCRTALFSWRAPPRTGHSSDCRPWDGPRDRESAPVLSRCTCHACSPMNNPQEPRATPRAWVNLATHSLAETVLQRASASASLAFRAPPILFAQLPHRLTGLTREALVRERYLTACSSPRVGVDDVATWHRLDLVCNEPRGPDWPRSVPSSPFWARSETRMCEPGRLETVFGGGFALYDPACEPTLIYAVVIPFIVLWPSVDSGTLVRADRTPTLLGCAYRCHVDNVAQISATCVNWRRWWFCS